MSPSQKLDISALLQQTDKAGVYVAEDDAAHLAFHTAASLGLNAYRIDLGLANNEQDLFKIFSHSMRFPDWFGNNWDASDFFDTEEAAYTVWPPFIIGVLSLWMRAYMRAGNHSA